MTIPAHPSSVVIDETGGRSRQLRVELREMLDGQEGEGIEADGITIESD